MYEYGMSELVKSICESYASAMGANFPPCVQQEINAMAAWINTVTVKDFNVASDGKNITFTVTVGTEEKTFNIPFPVSVMNTTIQDMGNGFVITVEKLDGTSESTQVPITEYVTVTPASATSGSVTEAQLITLNKNGSNILVYNNRYYRRTVVYGSKMYYTAEDDGSMYQVIVDSLDRSWTYTSINYNSRITSESERAKAEEAILQDNIDSEASRAKSAEATILDQITKETTRAKNAETALSEDLSAETARAEDKETRLADSITVLATSYAGIENTVVKLTGDQTVKGVKTFTDYIKTPQVANTDGKALVRYKDTEVKSVFGNDSSPAVLMGNTDRPYYSKSGSDFTGVELALKSDITGGGGSTLYRHTITFGITSPSARYVVSGSTYSLEPGTNVILTLINGDSESYANDEAFFKANSGTKNFLAVLMNDSVLASPCGIYYSYGKGLNSITFASTALDLSTYDCVAIYSYNYSTFTDTVTQV